jgi:hypothetical protein
MIWDTWVSDSEVTALERELNRIGTSVVKMNGHVRIGAFSKTKIFDVETFKQAAAEIIRTRGSGQGRGQKARGRSDGNRSSASGIAQAEVETASATLSSLVTGVLSERDQWRARALEAESKLASYSKSSARTPNVNVDKIKRQLARELHPDATSDEEEKKLRAKLFKQIWPLVEKLDET